MVDAVRHHAIYVHVVVPGARSMWAQFVYGYPVGAWSLGVVIVEVEICEPL